MASELNNNNSYNIFNFLDERIVEKGSPNFTHSSMGKPCAIFNIKNADMDLFYDLYEKAIFSGTDLHLLEKHEEFGPVVIDLDFKYDVSIDGRQHTIDHIQKIVSLYIHEIIDIFDIDTNDTRLDAFVFEKPGPYQEKSIKKDGIHIMFPNIITYPNAQFYIRENILKKIGSLIEDLPKTNQISDIVDRSVIQSNGWLFYGSKKPKNEAYQLTYIFNGKGEQLSMEDYDFPTNNLVRFFSIRNRHINQLLKIRDEKGDLIEKITNKPKKISLKKSSKIYDVELIRSFVSIFNIERCENYLSWHEVGWALYNIDSGSQELLEIWIEFSKRSPKFKEGECEKEWPKSKTGGLGIGSIYYWARSDNPEKYKEIMDRNVQPLIEKSIKTPTDYDIASVLFFMYKHEFKYTGSEWFIFKENIWHQESNGMSLRQKISNELCIKYMEMMSKYNALYSSTDINITEEDKEEAKKKTDAALPIISKLRSTANKQKILKECEELFYDRDFANKLDTNLWLIGFENGIYDLNSCTLRDGRPDDYVSITTEINKIDFDEENEHWPDLKKFIETIFVQDDVREYYLTYLATCLQGHNEEQKFHIWTGTGSNGKSKIMELFVRAFGKYTIKFPVTMLTQKRAASNACTPEIVQSKGKRFGYLEEPSAGEKINAGMLKEFSGNDKIYARGLHKDPIEFYPQFKLSLLCNDIPEVPAHDFGIWRRLIILEFKSKFCENPVEPNEFPLDKYLTEKMEHWPELFMAYLLDVFYKKYKNSGYKLSAPYEVRKYTDEFKDQCDSYNDFTLQFLMDTTDIKNDIVNINELYEHFKIWYSDSYSNTKYPSKIAFREYLLKKYQKKRVTQKELKGFKFRIKYDTVNSTPDNLITIPGY